MMRKASALIALGLKLLITVGLITYLLRKIDIAPVLRQIRMIEPAWAVLSVVIMLAQLALVSLRWQLVSQLVDARMRIGQVVRLTLIGQFFNQVLPSAVGGDAVRAWLASREGVPIGRAVTGILCDRVAALVALMLIISCTFFVLPALVPNRFPAIDLLRIFALIGLSGLAALFIFGTLISRLLMRYRMTASIGKLVRDLRKVLYSPGMSIGIMALAGVVQILLVMAIYLCAKGMNIYLEFNSALVVIPTIMLVSMIPISFAGWGVREGAMILGLGFLGISEPDALAVSVAFGLLQLIVGLPGGALWLVRSGAAGMGVGPKKT
jgi:glycosyltransferase 2 family protein